MKNRPTTGTRPSICAVAFLLFSRFGLAKIHRADIEEVECNNREYMTNRVIIESREFD